MSKPQNPPNTVSVITMKSDTATLATHNEKLVNTTTFATNDEVLNMTVEKERRNKDVEEFESIFRSNNCQLTGDKEFVSMYNMMSFQYDEMESVHEFNKAFDEDVTEQDSGYQEVICPTLEGGCSMDEFEEFYRRGDDTQGIMMRLIAGSSVKDC
jgi:hypothetical protein